MKTTLTVTIIESTYEMTSPDLAVDHGIFTQSLCHVVVKFRVTDTEIVQDILDTILTEIGVFSSHKVTAVHFFSATRRIVGSTGPRHY